MARNPLLPFRTGGLAERGVGVGDPFLSLHREVNRLFDDVLRGAGQATGAQGGGVMMAPQMDVSETEKEIRVCIELPGVAEKDVDVTLDDDVLTVRGEKKVERKEEKENYHFVERSFGTFQRSVRLPYPINPEQVQARFENGVLAVTLPKTAREERARRIQVQAGGGSQGAVAGQDGQQNGSPAAGGSGN